MNDNNESKAKYNDRKTVRFTEEEFETIKPYFEGSVTEEGKKYTFSHLVRDVLLGKKLPEKLQPDCPKRKLTKCELKTKQIAHLTASNFNQIAHKVHLLNRGHKDVSADEILEQIQTIYEFVRDEMARK